MRYQIATLAIALILSATTVARADGGENNEGRRHIQHDEHVLLDTARNGE